MSDGEADTIVRLRGMPWSSTAEDVLNFLGSEVHVLNGKDGIHFTYTRDGRASGEAFVELESEDDVENALKKSNENMGNRYVEVIRAKRAVMEWCMKLSSSNTYSISQPGGDSNTLDEGIVRLRGIPFGCSKEEIANFFSGLEIVTNGIVIPVDSNGRTAGNAYVKFASKEAAEKALEKHKECIAHRYIEIFKSNRSEMESASMRSFGVFGGGGGGGRNYGGGTPQRRMMHHDRMLGRGPPPQRDERYSGGYDDYGYGGRRAGKSSGASHSGLGHFVQVRGIHYKATESDAYDFFAPLRPISVHTEYNRMAFAFYRSERFTERLNAKWLRSEQNQLLTHSLRSSPSGSMTAKRKFPLPRVAAACFIRSYWCVPSGILLLGLERLRGSAATGRTTANH